MKLLVCDVEGTIFNARYKIDGMDYASTMWQPLAQSLGEEGIRREKELHDRWERGEFKDYLDWVEATYQMHRELGLTKQTFEHLLSCAEYNPGVIEFFKNLDRKKYIPVLISGGFQELVRRAQVELKIPHGHGACEYIFDKRDDLLYSHSLVPCDFEGKYRYVEMLFTRYNLDEKYDWVFIGDGKNDCDIAKRAPVSFAFNGHQELKNIATYQIDDAAGNPASFSEISKILNKLADEDYRKGYEQRVDRFQADAASNEQRKKADAISKKSKKEVLIQKEDYETRPERHLSEILEDFNIAFIGLKESYSTYKKLEEQFDDTRKFKLIEANFEKKNNTDIKALKRRDFIFICVDCISHSHGWRIEEVGVPFAKIRRQVGSLNETEPLVRAMANVLYRFFYEGE